MLSDLRFAIGAVLAIALLGVTVFGLAATMHISHQSKLSPLEASRMLAYTPDVRHRILDIPSPRGEGPFANIAADPNPVPLQQPSAAPVADPTVMPATEPVIESVTEPIAEPTAPPMQTAAIVPPVLAPTPEASPAVASPAPDESVVQPTSLPPSDTDTVDERAVIDPPLPLDGDAPAQSVTALPVAPSPEPERTPEPVPGPEPASAPRPTIETTTAPAAPVVEAPVEPADAPDVPQVASIPPTVDAPPEPRTETISITEMREAPKAKRGRKTARVKRPVRRLMASPTATQLSPFFPLGPAPISSSNAQRPASGFWSVD